MEPDGWGESLVHDCPPSQATLILGRQLHLLAKGLPQLESLTGYTPSWRSEEGHRTLT